MHLIKKILITALIITMLTVSARAYAPSITNGQENIVKRARQLTEIKWTPRQDIYKWNYNGVFKTGTTYTGLPYGQPVYTKGYIGWNISLDGFLKAVSDKNSSFYKSYSWYNKIAPYYSIDCSAFVSYAWGMSTRFTTTTLPNYAQRVYSQKTDSIQVGDALNKAGVHTVLISAVDLSSAGKVQGVKIMEATPSLTRTLGFGTLGSNTMANFNSRYFSNGYVLYRNPNRYNVDYVHSCAVPIDGDSCKNCSGYAAVSKVTASINGGTVQKGTKLTLSTATQGAAIYYTTDGGKPSAKAALYKGPITIGRNMTVRAIAIKSGHADSPVSAFTFTVSG